MTTGLKGEGEREREGYTSMGKNFAGPCDCIKDSDCRRPKKKDFHSHCIYTVAGIYLAVLTVFIAALVTALVVALDKAIGNLVRANIMILGRQRTM